MKKILIIVGAALTLIVIGIALVFYFTSGVVEVANSFFSAVKAGDYNRARGFLSEDFRAATPTGAMRDFLEQSALINYASANWGTRTISGSQGELEGEIKTRDSGTVPVKMTFVKENGFWKILSLRKFEAGILTGERGKAVPSYNELKFMANGSLHDLALAIKAGDFTDFYQNIARLWQSQTNKEDLLTSFKSFTDQNIDLTVLNGMDPVFDKRPIIDSNGFLALQGYYPTKPSVAYFELKYGYEYPEWKLVSINVSVR
jgi:hypothetical protein